MNSLHDATRLAETSRPRTPAAAKPGRELPVRVVVGVVLACIAIAVTLAGGIYFAGFVALAASAAAREWHRMVGSANFGSEAAVTIAAIIVSIGLVIQTRTFAWPLAALAAGAVLAAVWSAFRGAPAGWSALGAPYAGLAACALVALREWVVHGPWVVLGVFLVIWTADTGALLAGRLLGGPKLVPALSPNKTWAGLAGGLLLPALVAAGYVAIFRGSPVWAAILGLILATTGHAGDLFESWVKRRVGRKDSGELIPGHGGVLDRLDSTLFVAPIAAALVFMVDVGPLLGVQP